VTDQRRPGRPKGSGRGLVTMGLRVEPELHTAMEEYAEANNMKVPEATRFLLRVALELDEVPTPDAGYLEGLRQGRADFHQALNAVWKKLTP